MAESDDIDDPVLRVTIARNFHLEDVEFLVQTCTDLGMPPTAKVEPKKRLTDNENQIVVSAYLRDLVPKDNG